jgi:peptidyl-prolyl cis-trans isomerase D
MLSLNTLRTKFGIVLVVFLAIALLSFVLGEFKGCSQNENPEVGTITVNGETQSVAKSDFVGAYNDMLALMDNGQSEAKTEDIVAAAWERFKDQNVEIPSLAELGLVVTEEERVAMWDGESASTVLSGLLMSKPGFLDEVKAGVRSKAEYDAYNKTAVIWRAKEKFYDLVAAGAYVNSLMVDKGVVAENNTYNGKYVACDYSSILDSEVEVSDEEINAYYEANKAKYAQSPYRTISYAHFEISASENDDAAIKAKAEDVLKKLNGVEDMTKANAVSHVSVGSGFEKLNGAELEAISNGETYGLEKKSDAKNGYYYASREVDSRVVPSTFKLQHIVLPLFDDKLIDSVYNLATANGADFDALVEQYSVKSIMADEPQTISYEQLPVLSPEQDIPGYYQAPGVYANNLIDALATAKVGDVLKVNNVALQFKGQIMGEVALITKVLETGDKATHYRLAKLNYKVVETPHTRDSIYNKAVEFAQNASGSVENFENAETSVLKTSVNVDKHNRSVRGLNNSLELLRWAYRAEVGEVSPVFDLKDAGWVVGVVTAVNDAEYKTVDEVSSSIKQELIKQKKAALLKKKMQGASLEEIAANTESQIESFEGVQINSDLGGEERAAAALVQVTADNKGQVILVECNSGVYAVVVDEVVVNEETKVEPALVKNKLQADERLGAFRQAGEAVGKAVKVDDNTLQYF